MQVYYKKFSNELILRFYLICLKNIDIKYVNIILFVFTNELEGQICGRF